MAMEFATTALRFLSGLMTPGSLAAPGVFCLLARRLFSGAPRRDADWSSIAYCIDCHFWRHWDARALRPSRRRANSSGEHLSLRHAVGKFDGVLPAGPDRAIHDESPGDFAGLACRHRRRFLRWLHDVFQFRLGDGKAARGRRVAPRVGLCGRKRGGRTACFGCRNSSSE